MAASIRLSRNPALLAARARLAQADVRLPALLSVGVFDGVHLGHRAVLDRLVERAHPSNHATVVITFANNPKSVLGAAPAPPELTTLDERI